MTVERYPSLAHWGAFTALVDNGRVVGAEPFSRDPAPSRMIEAIPSMVHSPMRIARPAIREGWREGEGSTKPRTGHDTFREVSWDEALDAVAREIRRVRDAHGPTGIFGGSYGWSSAGRVHHARSLVRRFLALGGGFVDQLGNYSWGCAQFMLPHVIGTFSPVTGKVTDWPSVIKNTKLMIAFGGVALKNGTITSGGAGQHTMELWLRRAKEAGIEFVNVSPLKSDAPDFLDAQWIAVRPNTDTAVMLAMAYVVLTEDRHDKVFLASHCTGFDAFARTLTGETDGTPKTPEWAETISGVPAETIRDLARRASDARSLISVSWSLQRAHRGEQPFWASIALAAMLGGIGLPGGGFAFGHGSMNGTGQPRGDLPSPDLPLPANPARAAAIPVARIADMLLHPGQEYEFNGKRAIYPDIRMIYWAGGNPFHHHQDLNRFKRGWQKPDTIVVHEAWWTPTAKHADIVFPATTMLERNDIGGSSRDNFILAMHRAISPVGEARNDFEIFRALAARLGYEQAFTEGRDEMDWVQHVYDQVRKGAEAKGVELPGFQQFWAEGFVELPPPDRDFVLFEDFRHDPVANLLKTPSGKIEIVSETIAKFGYDDCPPQPSWMPPAEWLGAPEAVRWPVHLITHQPASRLHSQMDPGPVSQSSKVSGREPIRLNPGDADARKLRDGDIARVFNGRGACLAGVIVDPAVMPSVAVMATGAWFDPPDGEGGPELHGNPNVLTLDVGTSRLAQGPSALSALVQIERYEAQPKPLTAMRPPTVRAAVTAAKA